MNLKAILYDFDGTLVNTEQLHYEVWNKTLSDLCIKIEEKDYLENYGGIPTPINSKRIIKEHGIEITIKELTNKRQKILAIALENHKVNYMHYAIESIRFFKSIGLRLAIVTGSPRDTIERIFTDSEIRSHFDFIITRDDVLKSKPDKESYTLAIKKLNALPKEIIVLEDTAGGISSAKAAKLLCYGVQSNLAMHKKLNKADMLFTDLEKTTDYIKKYVLKNHS